MNGFEFGTQMAISDNARKSNAYIDEANEIIASKNAEIRKLKHALALQQAQSAALLAQGRTLKERLLSVDPESDILKKTGRTMVKAKRPEIKLDILFACAFDRHARTLGIASPESLRERAE